MDFSSTPEFNLLGQALDNQTVMESATLFVQNPTPRLHSLAALRNPERNSHTMKVFKLFMHIHVKGHHKSEFLSTSINVVDNDESSKFFLKKLLEKEANIIYAVDSSNSSFNFEKEKSRKSDIVVKLNSLTNRSPSFPPKNLL
uniref:Uncharacterized protein n=1 Tax=Romanomermis culicivorax TaxID=13658 RepID=A0A915HSU5_ROMCU